MEEDTGQSQVTDCGLCPGVTGYNSESSHSLDSIRYWEGSKKSANSFYLNSSF